MDRSAWLAAAGAVALTSAALLFAGPAIGFDAVQGIVACEQQLAGRQNALTELSVADPDDLSRDAALSVSWWAPGSQVIFCALRRTGLDFSSSVKALVTAAWFVGVVAWSRYFSLALTTAGLLPWLVSLFVFYRLSYTSALVYSGGETLLWAACPLAVLVNLSASRRAAENQRTTGPIFAAGAISALLIVVKYSGALIAIGFALSWVWTAARGACRVRHVAEWVSGAGLALSVAAVAGQLPMLPGVTPASALTSNPPVASAVWAFTGPLSAIADLNRAADTVVTRTGWDVRAAVLPAAVMLFVLVGTWLRLIGMTTIRRTVGSRPAITRLVVSITVATAVGLFVLLVRGGTISTEARHHQYTAFLLLPLLAELIAAGRQLPLVWTRRLSAAMAGVLVFPAVFGAVLLAWRVGMTTVGQPPAVMPDGRMLHLAGIESQSGQALRRELDALPIQPSTILATTTFATVLMRPDARPLLLMREAFWKDRRFEGLPEGGVIVFIQAGISDEDAATCLRSFADVKEWTPLRLRSIPGARLWHGR